MISPQVYSTPGNLNSACSTPSELYDEEVGETSIVCQGNNRTMRIRHQMNALVTRDTPISRPTSIIIIISSRTTDSTTASVMPRNPLSTTRNSRPLVSLGIGCVVAALADGK